MAKIVLRFIKAARYPRNGIVNITVPSTCSVLTGARSSPSFASPFVISVLPSLRTTRCVTKLSFRLYVMISPIFGSFLFVSVNTSPPDLWFHGTGQHHIYRNSDPGKYQQQQTCKSEHREKKPSCFFCCFHKSCLSFYVGYFIDFTAEACSAKVPS